MKPRRTTVTVILLVLCAVASAGTAVPGHLSVDEVAYDWQTLAFARGHGIWIPNSYEVAEQAQLAVSLHQTIAPQADGHLVSKYPPGAALLAAPLYRALGARALAVVNSVALALVFLGTWWLARGCGRSRREADLAVALLVGGTYAWQYGQALWPHAVALCAVVWACVAALEARTRDGPRLFLAAGLMVGVGITARLDIALAAPGVLVLGLMPGRSGPREIGAFAVGTVPGLLLLSGVNSLRHGLFFPLAYPGMDVGWTLLRFTPLVLGAGVVVALALKPELARRGAALATRPASWAVAGGLGIGLLVAVPPAQEMAERLLRGLWTLLVDLRGYPADKPPLARTEAGGLLYIGALKKSLFQSVPWLVLTPWVWRLGVPSLRALIALPALIIVAFSASSWHGGLCLNLRYFLPVLPLGAVMAAAVLGTQLDRGRGVYLGAGVLGGALLFLSLVGTWPVDVDDAETALLLVPLVLAGSTVLALLVRRPTLVLFAAGLAVGWAGAVSHGYDLPATRRHRTAIRDTSVQLQAVTPHGAVVVCPVLDPCGGLKELVGATVAQVPAGELSDFLAPHLAAGAPTLVGDTPGGWQDRVARGDLEGLEVQDLGELIGWRFVALRPATAASP